MLMLRAMIFNFQFSLDFTVLLGTFLPLARQREGFWDFNPMRRGSPDIQIGRSTARET
jgi:hypothetical protein